MGSVPGKEHSCWPPRASPRSLPSSVSTAAWIEGKGKGHGSIDLAVAQTQETNRGRVCVQFSTNIVVACDDAANDS